jgi:hypothetical protein
MTRPATLRVLPVRDAELLAAGLVAHVTPAPEP